MSHRFGPPLITGAHVHGSSGLGVLAELVPSTGEHGPGIASTWLGPAEAGKEVRVLITQWPEVGSLFVWEDTSFEYTGPGGIAYAQLYVEGQPVDTPQPVTMVVGAGVSGALSAQEAGADTAAIAGAVIVAGSLTATEHGADTVIIVSGNVLAGYLAAQESGSDTAAASGVVVVSGALSASEAGADGFAASGSIGSSDIIGNFAALESGADSIVVSGVVVVSGSMAAAEAGSDTMQTDNGEWYPSSRTITVPSGRTITLRPR